MQFYHQVMHALVKQNTALLAVSQGMPLQFTFQCLEMNDTGPICKCNLVCSDGQLGCKNYVQYPEHCTLYYHVGLGSELSITSPVSIV